MMVNIICLGDLLLSLSEAMLYPKQAHLFRFELLLLYPHLLLSPLHFQNSLSTFSIERINEIPLWYFYPSDFQRALKIIIIAELFIVMTISPGQLRHKKDVSRSRRVPHGRSYLCSPQVTKGKFQFSKTGLRLI